MNYFENDYFRKLEYEHPFSVDKFTRLIDIKNTSDKLSGMDIGAMLSRYSRSTKSMEDVLKDEFITNPNKGNEFYLKYLSQYGDDSIAELFSKQVGIEGISILAATQLTDRRIGVSFLEKSTRYVPFSVDSFYTPEEFYNYGIVDDYKELCALSHRVYTKIYNELLQIVRETYSINDCVFPNGSRYSQLKDSQEIETANKAYERAIKDAAFDNASYCYLTSLTTNIGFNANCRAIEYLLRKLHASRLSENRYLADGMLSLLDKSIHPFLTRINFNEPDYNVKNSSLFNTYNQNNSIISVYKHNILNLLKAYTTFQEDIEHIDGTTKKNPKAPRISSHKDFYSAFIDKLLFRNSKTQKETKIKIINQKLFGPLVNISHFTNEQTAIDLVCAAILSEYNENLLDYDEKNCFNNIDSNLRIKDIDPKKVKEGIFYDIINQNKSLDEISDMMYDTMHINEISENTLRYNDFLTYFEENQQVDDTTLYQDYDSSNLLLNRDQQYLITEYTKNRETRRDTLGRAFEMVDYIFDISSSFRVFRDIKRHRLNTLIKSPVITTRNSFDNYIFPSYILKNEHLLKEYKHLIEKSYSLYEKVIKVSNGDYITAQYVLPLATKVNYSIKINLRALDYLLSLRTVPQGHWEYVEISQQVYQQLKTAHPNLAKLLKFVNLNKYPLGRLSAEYKILSKLKSNGE